MRIARRLHTLQFLLILLVLLAMIPVMGLALYEGLQAQDRAEVDAYEDALRAAHLLAVVQEGIASRTHQFLDALTFLPEVRSQDRLACQATFDQLLPRNPEYSNIFLLDPSNRPVASARPMAPVSALPELPSRMTQELACTYTFHQKGSDSRRIIFTHPIQENGETRGVIGLEYDLDTYTQVALKAKLPENTSFAICDQEGVIQFRHPDPEQWTGKTVTLNQAKVIQGLTRDRDSQTSREIGLDGVPRLYAYKRLQPSQLGAPLFLRVGIPEQSALGKSQTLFFRNLVFLGLLTVLGLFAAKQVGERFILKPKDAFVDMARRIRQGDISARTGLDYDQGEFGELAMTFDSMADVLIMREQEQKRHAEQLQAQEERIRALFNATSDSVMLLDTQGVILAANAYCAARRGRLPAELPGSSLKDIVAPDIAVRRMARLQTVVDTGREIIFDEERNERIYRLRIYPIRDPAGQVVQLASFSRDITERRQAEAEILKSKKSAEEANAAKTTFLHNMSHELRTPLNGILGMGQLLLDSQVTAEQREYLELLLQSSRNLLNIVNDLLDLSSIETGRLLLKDEAFSLRGLLESLFLTFEDQARRRGLLFRTSVASEIPDHIRGDEGRLAQVLINLLSNAVKFTPRGEVRVGVDLAPGTAASACDFNPLDGSGSAVLLFHVADTGLGIPSAKQQVIFEGFVLVEDLLTKRYGGTGLGLAICRQLVEKMGGGIWVESQEHQGSTFYFSVRVAIPARVRRRLEPQPAGDSPDSWPVLLYADDNPSRQAHLSWMLHSQGLTLTAVDSLEAAAGRLASGSFQVLLLPLDTDQGRSLDLVRRIRAGDLFPAPRDLPVAALCPPLPHEEEARHFLQAGITELLTLPVAPPDLVRTIIRLMARPGLPAAPSA